MPAISRLGDQILSPDGSGYQCAAPLVTTVGQVNSSNFYVNGLLVPVMGDLITPHPKTGCSTDTSPLSVTSTKFFVGGLGVGRIGDMYGNNLIIQGSPNFFVQN